MRRLFLCALISVLGLMCFLAMGAGAEKVTLDGIRYEIKDGYACFLEFVEGAESVTAHATVNGYETVYLWGGEPPYDLTVKEIVAGPGITRLDNVWAFADVLYMCPGVERIVLPAGLTNTGGNFSYMCESLREFAVAEDNPVYQAIGGVLFSKDGKTLLAFPQAKARQYDVPAGTVSIGQNAFGRNERLTHLTLPEGLTQLSESALRGLTALREIALPASLERIGSGALPGEGALERIAVAEGNPRYQSFDGVLFSRDGKTLLVFPAGRGGHYDIPPGTTAVAEDAFGDNASLESLTIPEGIAKLSGGTLSQLRGLRLLSLPASLRSIGDWTLPRYGALEQITVAEGNGQYQTYEGVLFSRDGKTLLYYPAGRKGAYEIPPGTLFLARNAFAGNEGLTGVTVPDGVVTLAEGLFSNAGGLEEIYLPATIKEIGAGALPGYGALRRVEVAQGNQRYRSMDGVLFEGNELMHYPPSHGLSYDVPAGTMSIRKWAFSNNEMLETISIPRSVTEIGEGTFYRCAALARVSLPITLTKIGRVAFSDCIALSGITLPPGLAVLEGNAFSNCPSLAQIHVPDGVTELGENVFEVHRPDFVLYAAKGSLGYWQAWEYDLLWAEPGGTPGTAKPAGRAWQAAVVNNASNQEALRLLEEPHAGAKSLGEYLNGTTVQVLDTKGDWAHVRLYGAEGYMPAKSLMFTDTFNGLVRITWGRKRRTVTEPLRLYAGPWEQAPSEAVTEDVSMRILDTVGVWYHVLLQGREGYVPVQNLNVAYSRPGNYEDCFVVANPNLQDRLYLRVEPSIKSLPLGRYFNGTQVEALDYDQEGWVHVRVDGKEGYMMLQYLVSIDWGGEESLWREG